MKKLLLFLMIFLTVGLLFVSCNSNKSQETNKKVENEFVTSGKLKEIFVEIKKEFGSDFSANYEYTDKQKLELFKIDPKNVKEIIAQGPITKTTIDTIIGIQTLPASKSEVKKMLDEYKTTLLENQTFEPSDKAKVKAAKIIEYKNYTFFIMLGKIDKQIQDPAELQKQAEIQNQRAVKAIEKIIIK